MSRSSFINCPRCGTCSYERLATHSHCVECFFSDDLIDQGHKRDFLTLKEAESLIPEATVHEMNIQLKKVQGQTS